MKRVILLILGIVCIAGVAQAYDPPQIIGVLTSPQEESNGFAADFCWIGDQNGDGYDDLLINHYRSQYEIYLYEGNDSIANAPAYTYRPYEDGLLIGKSTVYLGRIRGEENIPMVGFCSVSLNQNVRIDLYELGQEIENNPNATFLIDAVERAPLLDCGFRNRPLDFNGDGFNDIIVMKASVGFQVYYGGDDLDTLADWSRYLYTPDWSSGLDINGDNCGDILIFTRENDIEWYSLYLGGNPPDTIPAVRVRAADYNLTESFTMLPDVNGDGYDDWGAYWYVMRPSEDDGFHIFFGGEEPDAEPDLHLEGTRGRFLGIGNIAGGDVNGDSIGDIITICSSGQVERSEMLFHFGNRWIAEVEYEHRADLYLDMSQEYGGEYFLSAGQLGAAGDYNGDGVDDFVYGGGRGRNAVIFAGSRDWETGVPKEDISPQDFDLTIQASPNPFNDSTTIVYSLSHQIDINLTLFDVNGRLLRRLSEGSYAAGEYRVSISDLSSGLYLVILRTSLETCIQKIVCLK